MASGTDHSTVVVDGGDGEEDCESNHSQAGSSSGYTPMPGGAFSALTSSMWPQDILAKLAQPESVRSDTNHDFDEFGFCLESDSPRHPGSAQTIHQTSSESEKHKLTWLAYLEFSENSSVSDLTWDRVPPVLRRCDKLESLVARGVPHAYRSQVWPRLCSGLQKRENSETSYKELVRLSGNDHLVTAKQIEKDLLRTLPGNVCFAGLQGTGVPRLRRVLRCLAWTYPDIGYCQGTGVVVACLLMVLEEEDAYWVMSSVVEELLPPSYYTSSLMGVQADQGVLTALVTRYLPRLASLLRDHDIELPLITLNWFLTLFASVVHTRVLMRLWDLFFYHGSIVLFQVALGMLKRREPDLLGLDNSAHIFNALSDLPGEIGDVDELIHVSSSLTADLTIPEIRDMHRAEIARLSMDEGSLITPELSQKKLSRRQVRPHKTIIQQMLFGGSSADDELHKAKNVHQTELLVRLREAIVSVVRHFQSVDPRHARLSVIPDYSLESHQKDHENFMNVMRCRRRRAKALLDFERHDDDELGFKKNDIIVIISQTDEHCWVGELNGLRGWFPAKFVEVLDERSKQYSVAGDDAINEAVTDLIRGNVCSALKAVFEHGLKKSSILGGICHPWLFIEEAAGNEIEKDFNSVYSRLVLCKTFRLDEDSKVLSSEEILYRAVQAVNASHDPVHAQMDVKFRTLMCLGLNEQVLHLWLETLCSSVGVVEKWYQPWSFFRSPGWIQIKCEMRILSNFAFNLSPTAEITVKKEVAKPLKDGVQDMLVKHHLFSWDL